MPITQGMVTRRCPHDGRPARHQTQLEFDALCFDCVDRATDDAGRRVELLDEDGSGGFAAVHRDDGSRCLGVMTTRRVRIDGSVFRAGAARQGGVVVRPMSRDHLLAG